MSSPLSQDLAQKIIEVLLQRGHVLLSKGGKPALVRELSDRMNDTLATIIGRLPPPGIVDNEVTSTFGDEALDDAVEEMVEDVTASLMDSDQVEDVFSEDAVIRRDVFRIVKDALLSADRAFGESEEADVEVALQTLGYVATKAAQGAEPAVVEVALSRAAKASRAKLLKYTPATQTALFRAALGTPDARLELEEAVADELSNLVDEGKVALPTVERRIPLGRSVASDERHATRARIDVAATRTLLRSGCTATWEYAGDDTLSVSLVPMSDQDGRAVDPFVEAFAREVQSMFSRPRAAEPSAGVGLDAWLRLAHDIRSTPAPARPVEKAVEKAPSSRRSSDAPLARSSDRPGPASGRGAEKAAPASKRGAEKAAPASKRSAEKAAPASKRSAEKAAPASKRGEEQVPSSQRSLASKPARKDIAAKNVKASPKEPKAPAKKPAAKKPAAKKAEPRSDTKPRPRAKVAKKPARSPAGKVARQGAAKKSVAKKPVARKSAKKPVAKKPVARRSAKKPVAKKPVARKPAKKPVAKKPVARKRPGPKPAKRPLPRKPVAKKPAKRPVAKRPGPKPAKRPVARGPGKKPVAKRPGPKPAKKPLPKRPVARKPAKRPVAKKPAKRPVAKRPGPKPAKKPVARRPAPSPTKKKAAPKRGASKAAGRRKGAR